MGGRSGTAGAPRARDQLRDVVKTCSSLWDPFVVSVRIVGSVSSISESGNLVTDITADRLAGAPRDERVSVRCDDHETNGIFDVGHEQPAMTLIALVGRSNCLEMEIVGDSARIMLGVSLGQKVEVCW